MAASSQSGRTSARELLADLLAKDRQVVAARIGDRVVDLHTPIEVPEGATVKPIRAGDEDALAIIRHSAAHLMADAVQQLFPGTKVTIGPSTRAGFFYDFDRAEGTFTEDDLSLIEKKMKAIADGKHPFVREVVSREAAHKLFADMGESYKRELIDAIPEGEEISLYRHGGPDARWVDLCQGPHVPHTGFLKSVKLTSVAGAYWRGDERNPMLQRIYGTAFHNGGALRKHLRLVEEAKKRDHRKLGKELDLFMFHEYAPAMPFFLPRGTHIYNKLVQYMRGLYTRYGYQEVLTPQVFDARLFETSGHLPNYRDNMYMPVTGDMLDRAKLDLQLGLPGVKGDPEAYREADVERRAEVRLELDALERLGMKPMNCPSHCLIFKHRRRSYRELPWRVADFCRLHRYERGGVVHGLARVRSFSQDDAHIFCTPEQLLGEVDSFVSLLFEVYQAFQFSKIDVKLATRPEKRIGNDAEWDLAEAKLEEALKHRGIDYEILAGEGAFYGPKLEFHIEDALQRSWQLGTIQLDYNLPERFDLSYTAADGKAHRPVMLHRVILGSLERFMAVYIEHTGGNFPCWLAPEQVVVVTVSEGQNDYALEVAAALEEKGLRARADISADKLGAKIRKARLMRVPYIAVVGDKEVENRTVSPRSRDLGRNIDAMSLTAFVSKLAAESAEPRVQAQTATPDDAAIVDPDGAKSLPGAGSIGV